MIGKNGNKKTARLRRAKKSRQRIYESGSHRLSVFKSLNHIYVQVITPSGDRVIKTISSNQKNLKAKVKSNNIEGSKICLLYTSPSPRDATLSRMPSSA